MVLGIAIGVAAFWLTLRLQNTVRNKRVHAEFDKMMMVQSAAGSGCEIVCVPNGFPWVGATCTIYCPPSGGGGLYQFADLGDDDE